MAVREKKRQRGKADSLPKEVEFILSALEAGIHGRENQRTAGRLPYRCKAVLQLYSDPAGTPPWILYARDVSPRSLGFITRHRLPLGYGGIVELLDVTGETIRVDCTLLRCREAVAGWFEGALYFNRHQNQFVAGSAESADETPAS
jgi:hypothetical protein